MLFLNRQRHCHTRSSFVSSLSKRNDRAAHHAPPIHHDMPRQLDALVVLSAALAGVALVVAELETRRRGGASFFFFLNRPRRQTGAAEALTGEATLPTSSAPAAEPSAGPDPAPRNPPPSPSEASTREEGASMEKAGPGEARIVPAAGVASGGADTISSPSPPPLLPSPNHPRSSSFSDAAAIAAAAPFTASSQPLSALSPLSSPPLSSLAPRRAGGNVHGIRIWEERIESDGFFSTLVAAAATVVAAAGRGGVL